MSELHSHDWLSAYLDHEMPPDERALAELRLPGDPHALRELNESRELGELLRSLPSNELPAGFSSIVLQRCERETLLPTSVAAIPAKTPSRNSRSVIAVIAGVAATAAMLFLVVQAVSTPESSTRLADNRREAPKGTNIARRNQDFKQDKDALAVRDDKAGKADGAEAGSSVRSAVRRTRSKSTAMKEADGSPRGAAPAPMPGGRFAVGGKKDNLPLAKGDARRGGGAGIGNAGAQPDPNSARFAFGGRTAGIRIGEVVPYLHVSGDRTAVIEVTVVDVNEAVGRLEVLLERKLVKSLSKAKSEPGKTTKSRLESKLLTLKSAQEDKSKSELIAVYVESTQAQLAQVMRELDKETKSLHVSLRPPVALGDVRLKPNGDSWANLFRRDRRRAPQTLADAADYARKSVIGRRERTADGTTAKPKNPQTGAANSVKSARGKRSLGAGTPAVAKQKKDGSAADPRKRAAAADSKPFGDENRREGKKGEVASQSFQVRLKLAAQPTPANEKRDPPAKAASTTPPPTQAVRPARDTRPVQVIFVFRRTDK